MPSIEEDDKDLRAINRYFLDELVGARGSFHKFLNCELVSPDWDHACATFNMKDDLLGNPAYGVLHGGVIASMLDIAGGHAVFINVCRKLKGQPLEKQFKRLKNVSSIDLRIDYLRPGKGKHFIATGQILRFGNKVAVARAELRNEIEDLIAVGTGTYTVG